MAIIVVKATPRDITVEPTRLGFPSGSGPKTLRWLAVGTGTVIDLVEFKDAGAPIQDLHQVNGGWEGTWLTADQGIWGYTLTITVDGNQMPPLDPEIQNGPPEGA